MKIPRILPALLLTGFLPVLTQAQLYSAGITRADFVQLALEERALSPYDGTRCFTDVTNQSFAQAVCAAKQQGLITGDPSGKFRPHDPILFIEAAAVTVRAEGVSVPYDAIWYRPYLDLLIEWEAFPFSISNIYHPISYSQALEMLQEAEDKGEGDDEQDDVRLRVTASDDTPDPGDRVTFRIRLENTGNRDLRDVEVSAELDDDMDYISSSSNGDETRGEVEWDDLRLEEDESRTLLLTVEIDDRVREDETLRLRVTAGDRTVTESLRVSGRSDDDDDDDDDNDVRVTLSDTPDPVLAGGTLQYRIRLENRGNDRATLDVTAFLDDETSFASASDTGRERGDTVEWESIRVEEDETRTLTFWVRVDEDLSDGDRVTMCVEADGAEDSETTSVDEDRFSDNGDVRISITDAPDPVWRGEELTYRVTVDNLESHAILADIRATLDESTSFLYGSHAADLDGTDDVLWENVRIDGDDSETLSLTVRVSHSVDDGDTLSLRVRASNDEDHEETEVEP